MKGSRMSKSTLVATVRSLWSQEAGAVISAELVLVMTIATLGAVVGLSALSTSINGELEDLAEAFGAVSQSYCVDGIRACAARVSGSSFNDQPDHCDCIPIEFSFAHFRASDKCE
jgi:hypothetical protein